MSKMLIQKDTWTPMFTAAIFIMCIYTHTQWNTTQPKKNEIRQFATTWMQLESIILNEVNQKKKDKYHTMSFTCEI